MEKANSRYFVVGAIVTIMVAVVGVTYAYWRGQIQGEGSNVRVTLDKVYIQFTDSTQLAEKGVKPGWSTSKTFTIENQGNIDFKYDIYIKDLINTLVTEGYFQYKITSNNNGYNMEDYAPIAKSPETSDFDLGTGITIGAGVKQTYTIEFRYVDDPDVDQSEDMGKKFSGVLAIRENNSKTLYSTLTNGSVYEIGERTNFSTVFGGTTIQDGYNQTGTIYKTGNDYYFAGNPSDNWVYFADKWWRIIRTNSTEGTRLLYAGTSHDGQDGYINNTTYVWNSNYNSADYVQWSNASFKDELTNWYDVNITGTNANMVNSVVYCNDTSVTNTSGSNQQFGAYGRLNTNKAPNYACETNGNNTHKSVGLMTADEVAFAGGKIGNDAPNTYYYRNSKPNECTGTSEDPCSVTGDNYWWTMSPLDFYNYATIFAICGPNSPGHLGADKLNVFHVVRPVITLKPSVLASGSGTTDDPYIVVSDGSNNKLDVKVSSNDENMGTVNPINQKVSFGEDAIVTLNPKSGYVYKSNTCGGVVENNVMTIKNVTNNKECSVTFEKLKTLYATLSDGVKYTASTKSSFSSPEGGTNITQGYSGTGKINKIDNNNYYFSGNPSDNWVKFAGFWWRIIRSNSSEGTRLLYAGSSPEGQDGYINNTTYVWNSNYNQYYYVQWDSYASFKSTLNSWYSSNITGTNDNMVNSIVYCNDTSYKTDSETSGWGTNGRKYGAYTRLIDAKSSNHTCGTNNFGSAAKVGMMTADEVAYAGGVYGQKAPNTYYYRNSKTIGCTGTSGDPCSVIGNNSWWTLSPNRFNGGAFVFCVNGAGSLPGYLSNGIVNGSSAVRPVITLKPEVLISGSGTTDDPFVPSL